MGGPLDGRCRRTASGEEACSEAGGPKKATPTKKATAAKKAAKKAAEPEIGTNPQRRYGSASSRSLGR